MKIAFLVNEVYGGWEPNAVRLGGTEESVVKWAECLAGQGHDVLVYANTTAVDYKGVLYYPREQYGPNHDVCVNIKSSEIPPCEPTVYLTNETNASSLDLSKYDGVIWPSQWAVDNIPVNNKKVWILPHGYDSNEIFPSLKVPKQCFYASSPDRGLETLIAAWPEVYKNHPDANLIVTYGGMVNVPGVINLGEVDDDTMNDIYRTSDVWCHPCNGGELFCITGIKAQAAGCVPVIIPTMALSETVRHRVDATAESYAEVLSNLLSDNLRKSKIREQLSHEHYPDWEETSTMLLQILQEVV